MVFVLEGQMIFYWTSVTLYAGSFCLYLISLVFKKEKLLSFTTTVVTLGFILHALAIVLRWVESGHGPYIGYYEIISSDVWVAVAAFLLAQVWLPRIRAAGVAIMPISFLLMGIGATASREIEPLSPALQSYWLIIHVSFAKLTFGSILVGTALGVLYLLKKKMEIKKDKSSFYERMPSLEVMDELGSRFIIIGEVFLTTMVVSGAIWANKAWGRYWGWDPIETWSLIAWLIYGFYLHLRITYNWQKEKAAWTLIFIIPFLIFALLGVAFVYNSVHTGYISK